MLRVARVFPGVFACLFWICWVSIPAQPVGTPAGTAVKNTATVDYSDGSAQQPTVSSNTVRTTVSQVAAATISPTSAAQSSAPGTSVTYAITVTNSGNGPDTLTLSAVSGATPAWPVALYRDDGANGGVANDGVRQPGETNLASSTGTLAADASFHCFLTVEIPSGSADSASDTTAVTATSQFDTQKRATATFTTTAQSALVTLSKSVDREAAAPGDTLLYTVRYRNRGSVTARNVVVTDTLHSATSYIPNSVSLNGSPKTDAEDADEVTVTSGRIVVRLGDLAAGAEGTFTFRAAVR